MPGYKSASLANLETDQKYKAALTSCTDKSTVLETIYHKIGGEGLDQKNVLKYIFYCTNSTNSKI